MALRSAVVLATALLVACNGKDEGPVVVDTAGGDGGGGSCGNGVVDGEDEECDGSDDCTEQCTMIRCGDGILSAGEVCDDGNDKDGDACTNSCELGAAAIVDIAVTEYHSCAVTLDSRVKCWGGAGPRLGQPGYPEDSIGDDEAPSDWNPVAVGDNVVSLEATIDETCALLDDGDVICWGLNNFGQLGYADGDDPVGDDETPAAKGPLPLSEPAQQIVGGESFMCALLAGGDVTCWGSNNSGQLGYGPDTMSTTDMDPAGVLGPVPLPAGTVVELAAGASHVCARYGSGDVACWGRNSEGQLGTGEPENLGDDETPESFGFIDLGGKAIDIDAYWNNTCAVLDDGSVRCWGSNTSGQIGSEYDDDVGDRKVPADDEALVLFDGEAVSVSVGTSFVCALATDDRIYCWGKDRYVGYPDPDYNPLPGQAVALGAGAVAVDCGYSHACAITTGGGVRCWGENGSSRLGNPEIGSSTTVYEPSMYGDIELF